MIYKNDLAGFMSAIGGAILPFIDAVTPFLQFIGVIFGVIIGFLTIREKLLRYKREREKRNGII